MRSDLPHHKEVWYYKSVAIISSTVKFRLRENWWKHQFCLLEFLTCGNSWRGFSFEGSVLIMVEYDSSFQLWLSIKTMLIFWVIIFFMLEYDSFFFYLQLFVTTMEANVSFLIKVKIVGVGWRLEMTMNWTNLIIIRNLIR